MVSIIRRMRSMKQLLTLRLGPGAAILPPEVTKIEMNFAIKYNDGHLGPRKFWRECLPRLKYHNPAVPMFVTRTTNQEGPALLTIHFTDAYSAASSKPPISSTTKSQTSVAPVPESTPMAPTERTEIISMKHKKVPEILAQLMAITKAQTVGPSAEDLETIAELEQDKAQSQRDAAQSAKVNAAEKRRLAVLAQARGEDVVVAEV